MIPCTVFLSLLYALRPLRQAHMNRWKVKDATIDRGGRTGDQVSQAQADVLNQYDVFLIVTLHFLV